MEDPQKLRRKTQQGWKNNVEQDLRRLLDRRGVLGAFLISKNGETVTQVFAETTATAGAAANAASARQKENSLMQIVRKLTPLVQGTRNVPLKRAIFETSEGSVVLYSMENGMVGCVVDKDFDVVQTMLDIHTVADMIYNHLNNTEQSRERQEHILRENREEFRAFSQDLLREIERHFGPVTTEQIIQRTVR